MNRISGTNLRHYREKSERKLQPLYDLNKAVFWDVAPCTYCVNRRFPSIFRVEKEENPLARNKREQVLTD
jgi:hypothetical protein